MRKILVNVFLLLSLFYISLGTNLKTANASEITTTVETVQTPVGEITVEKTVVPNALLEDLVVPTVGLSETEPNQPSLIVPYGASPPYFSYWDVSKDGTYNFSGSFTSSAALYSNYYIKGATSYRVVAQNLGSYDAGFRAGDAWDSYYTTNLIAKSTSYFTINMNSTSNAFYLKFYPLESGGTSISGYIYKN